ncbi:MAG: DUF6285 domain-containing protein [Microvirga sp.]
MLDKPPGDTLVEAVARLLRDEVLPALDGALSFKVRVAANVLDLVQREMAGGARSDIEECARLRALTGRDGETDALNRVLCAGIRDGDISLATPGLSDHLWATTLAKMAIEQPGYASYRRIMGKRRQEQP